MCDVILVFPKSVRHILVFVFVISKFDVDTILHIPVMSALLKQVMFNSVAAH